MKSNRLAIPVPFVRDKYSRWAKNVLRGHCYPIRQPQGKLVRVTLCEVSDVAVAIRKSIATFAQWSGAALSGKDLQATALTTAEHSA